MGVPLDLAENLGRPIDWLDELIFFVIENPKQAFFTISLILVPLVAVALWVSLRLTRFISAAESQNKRPRRSPPEDAGAAEVPNSRPAEPQGDDTSRSAAKGNESSDANKDPAPAEQSAPPRARRRGGRTG